MNSISIRLRILVLSALSITIIAATGGVLYWALMSIYAVDMKTKAFNTINMTSQRLEKDILQINQSEKEYIIRRDLKYAELVIKGFDEIQETVQNLSAIPESLPIINAVNQVSAGVSDYRKSFDSLMDGLDAVGLNENSGRQSELRNAVHAVEAELSKHDNRDLQVHMLMMRRFEKDYLLRGQTDNLKKMDDEAQGFTASLNAAGFDPTTHDALAQHINTYLAAFKSMVTADQAVRQATASIDTIYTGITPNFTRILEFANNKAEEMGAEEHQVYLRVATVAGTAGVLALVISLALTTLISRSIILPIKAMTSVMSSLSNGNKDIEWPRRSSSSRMA